MRPDAAANNGHALVVLPGAAHLRRVVGPTAWVVLEALLQNAEPTGVDEDTARRSIRDLAADLGLAKDKVARALRVLRDVGLISHDQHRADAGTFDPGRYAISMPIGVVMLVATLFAGTAATTAAYYTAYLTQADGELPGKWMGRQAAGFGLTGDEATDQLEALLLGRDPIDGTPLGKVFAKAAPIVAVAELADLTRSGPR
jgi:hypothetical protein